MRSRGRSDAASDSGRIHYPQPVPIDRDLVSARIRSAALAGLDVQVDDIEVVRPERPEHGDFSTNLALKLAGSLRRVP